MDGFVSDAVRLVGIGPQAPFPIGLVIGKVASKPANLAVALKGQYMCGDTNLKPAVVGDHHRTERENTQRLFECAKCFHNNNVG